MNQILLISIDNPNLNGCLWIHLNILRSCITSICTKVDWQNPNPNFKDTLKGHIFNSSMRDLLFYPNLNSAFSILNWKNFFQSFLISQIFVSNSLGETDKESQKKQTLKSILLILKSNSLEGYFFDKFTWFLCFEIEKRQTLKLLLLILKSNS